MSGPNRSTQRRIKLAGRWWREWTWFSDVGWACLLTADSAPRARAGLGMGRTRRDAREAATHAVANPEFVAGQACRAWRETATLSDWLAWGKRNGLPVEVKLALVREYALDWAATRFTDDEHDAILRWYRVRDRALRGEATYEEARQAAIDLEGRTPKVDSTIGRELAALARRVQP